MIDLNREEFEKLPEIAEILNKNGGGYYKEHTNDYHHCNLYFDKFLNGAWYTFQEQQKKLDCCREENKAHLEKIDELQARVGVVLRACDNLRKDIIREHHAEYDKGWKDCATSVYHQLKGNKDEN